MSTIDDAALERSASPSVRLLGQLIIRADGNSAPVGGFDAFERVYVELDVAQVRRGSGDAAIAFTIEQADSDGGPWTDAGAPMSFTRDGRAFQTVEGPSAFLRVAWETTGKMQGCTVSGVFATPGSLDAPASPGGSQPGAAIVRGPFSFAYNLAGLTAGVAFYTPTVDDVLLDAWFELSTTWDETAKADIGTFVGLTTGLLGANLGEPATLSTTPDSESSGAGILTGEASSAQSIASYSTPYSGYGRIVPARFTAANPLKLVVSADGAQGGADPGAGAGAAKLYIVTSTPAAFAP